MHSQVVQWLLCQVILTFHPSNSHETEWHIISVVNVSESYVIFWSAFWSCEKQLRQYGQSPHYYTVRTQSHKVCNFQHLNQHCINTVNFTNPLWTQLWTTRFYSVNGLPDPVSLSFESETPWWNHLISPVWMGIMKGKNWSKGRKERFV